jgi:hypothetical protein
LAIENAKARRWVGWAAGLVVVIGLAGWFGNRALSEARRQEAERRQDAENLRMIRYHDVLRDLDAVGDGGDEATRARCRHAIHLLALMEPGWYGTYRSIRPAPGWLSEPPAERM